MEKIKIGVIGVGGRGTLSDLFNSGEFGTYVAAGADPDAEHLAAFRERNPGVDMTTGDYRDILARGDIAAVAVFSPDYLHEEHAVAVLDAGKHLFLEKPMAITITGCDRILDAWHRSGRSFFMGFNMRYMNWVRTMKQIVAEGAIGPVQAVWIRHFVPSGGDYYFHDWHATRRNTTSLLLQKASHDIDIAHWIAGGHGTRVTGMGKRAYFGGNKPDDLRCDACGIRGRCPEAQNPDSPRQLCCFRREIDQEDVSQILWELDNGVQCAYQQCHFAAQNYRGRNYVFIGTEGMVENFWRDGHDCVEVTLRNGHGWKSQADRVYTVKNQAGTHSGADPVMAADFLDMLRNGAEPTASPLDGRGSVAVGCSGAESLRGGSRPVVIAPYAWRGLAPGCQRRRTPWDRLVWDRGYSPARFGRCCSNGKPRR